MTSLDSASAITKRVSPELIERQPCSEFSARIASCLPACKTCWIMERSLTPCSKIRTFMHTPYGTIIHCSQMSECIGISYHLLYADTRVLLFTALLLTIQPDRKSVV